MTNSKALLSQFKGEAGPLVTFGDNGKLFTKGDGKIISENVIFDDVALVVGLEVNLLRVSILQIIVLSLTQQEECTDYQQEKW